MDRNRTTLARRLFNVALALASLAVIALTIFGVWVQYDDHRTLNKLVTHYNELARDVQVIGDTLEDAGMIKRGSPRKVLP